MARILVTDDEEPIRTMMAEVLLHQGHIVIQARTAREALEEHRRNPADLIVTDLVMKEMDGTELLRRVRSFSPHTPIVGVSGHRHGKIYLNMAKMLGAERVLEKPFTPEAFLSAITAALTGIHHREPSAETA
jgi:DNA-binding response OmpR family regulator